MGYGLSMAHLPVFSFSSFRYFEKHERHLTRIFKSTDVLVMVFDGVLRFQENGVPIEVSAGEYYIQQKGFLQEGVRESDSPKYFFIHWLQGVFVDGEDTLPIRGKADFTELFPLFNALETLRLTGATPIELSGVVCNILSVLYKKRKTANASDVVAKVISHVAADIRRPFSLEDIAAYCGYSKNHIINIFKRETGKTPYTYILDMKIEMAKRLLIESESSQSSIAMECGFGGYSNFYRIFLKNVGCSPAVYRKRKHAESGK